MTTTDNPLHQPQSAAERFVSFSVEESARIEYTSYHEILGAEDPATALETALEHGEPLITIETLLGEATLEVAHAGADLELGLRTRSERRIFEAALVDHSTLLKLGLLRKQQELRGQMSEGEIKKTLGEEVMTAHENILNAERDIRLVNSWYERTKRSLGETQARRIATKLGLAAVEAGTPVLIVSQLDKLFPEEAESLDSTKLPLISVVGAVAITAAIVRGIVRQGGSMVADKAEEGVEDYAPSKVVARHHRHYEDQTKCLERLEQRINKQLSQSHFRDEAYGEEVVDALLGHLQSVLREQYLHSKRPLLRPQLAEHTSKLVFAGISGAVRPRGEGTKEFFDDLSG